MESKNYIVRFRVTDGDPLCTLFGFYNAKDNTIMCSCCGATFEVGEDAVIVEKFEFDAYFSQNMQRLYDEGEFGEPVPLTREEEARCLMQ